MWVLNVILLPVRGLGVSTPKEVPEGTRRGDLRVSGVEDHADVFGNNSGLDAVVELLSGKHSEPCQPCWHPERYRASMERRY